MEVVLLWLDDLDDFVFSAALLFESARRLALQLGLLSACAMAVCELAAFGADWVPTLTGLAAGSVLVWSASVAFRAFYYRQARISPRAA